MRSARYVPTGWALDPNFLALSMAARMLLYGLWTWPDTPTSGLTITHPSTIGRSHGIPERKVQGYMAELENMDFVRRDPDSIVIWIVGYLETQLGSKPNAKHKVNTIAALGAFPSTPMLARYRQEYGLADTVSDTVSDRVFERACDRPSLPVPILPSQSSDEAQTPMPQFREAS